MREHLETWLKIACLVLAGLLLLQLGRAFVEGNPLAHVQVPSPPELPPDTNSIATANRSNAPDMPLGKGSNTADHAALKPGTNLVSRAGTNANLAHDNQSTNLISVSASTNSASNSPPLSMATNLVVALESTNQTSNIAAHAVDEVPTNAISTGAVSAATEIGKTNKVVPVGAAKVEAGLARPAAPNDRGKGAMPPELAAMIGMISMGSKLPELPAATKAIIDRITESEILAPVIRPQPMALLGIAGDVAFLRAPNGQTGMIKEKETLGELKLLRIGINRVLVEQDGQKKELTIFSGYGGESLLTEPVKPNETTK
jgi:hypothetical protein